MVWIDFRADIRILSQREIREVVVSAVNFFGDRTAEYDSVLCTLSFSQLYTFRIIIIERLYKYRISGPVRKTFNDSIILCISVVAVSIFMISIC